MVEIITLQDLERAKQEIIDEVKNLLQKTNMEPSKKWVKSKQAREILHCSAGTLQNLRQTNSGLRFTRVGGTIYYDLDSIHEMLEKNKRS
jgi:hypothetical protein